ncbi:hypothetical protein SDC9_210750 [bioreactor metagenome]|uniref:Uncharacterized protein n=1 Tax=bioreactor metagenome TaxID=1076179 RepID=A0A645JHT6_9ZZZZ
MPFPVACREEQHGNDRTAVIPDHAVRVRRHLFGIRSALPGGL